METSPSASAIDFARVTFLMAMVDDHLDTTNEVPALRDVMVRLGIPTETVSEIFFEAARGWEHKGKRHDIVSRLTPDDEAQLVEWLETARDIMDADGIRHQQELAFLSQIASRLRSGHRLRDLLFPA